MGIKGSRLGGQSGACGCPGSLAPLDGLGAHLFKHVRISKTQQYTGPCLSWLLLFV